MREIETLLPEVDIFFGQVRCTGPTLSIAVPRSIRRASTHGPNVSLLSCIKGRIKKGGWYKISYDA
jgi:hypothetical protein